MNKSRSSLRIWLRARATASNKEVIVEKPVLMIHGVGCGGDAWDAVAPLMHARGWTPYTPTLFAQFRVKDNPTGQLSTLSLHDYVEACKSEALSIEKATGEEPVLMGHSMGGLIVQKMAEQGIGKAAILVTPAAPIDCAVRDLRVLFTFANVLLKGDPKASYKVWETGFKWGVLNCVPRERHAAIYANALYDSGLVYENLGKPETDVHKVAVIDERRITCPVLTIGGVQDRATVIASVRKIAQKYARIGGDYREYDGAAHWIVDEPKTGQMVTDICDWLATKGL
jgi:alpha-beta hydrolase superfamily lysophospholipase